MSHLYALPDYDYDECYVSRKAMAGLLGISVRSFDELCARGRREGFPPPAEGWGLRRVVFPPARTIRWAREMSGKAAAA